MIVCDLDVICVTVPPPEADSPLIINADAILSRSITRQLLKPIAWRNTEVTEVFSGVDNQELSKSGALKLKGPPPHPLSLKDVLGIRVPETLDHWLS
jgi:hypothetical protein